MTTNKLQPTTFYDTLNQVIPVKLHCVSKNKHPKHFLL